MALGLVALTAACARPVGDLGRAEPDYLHDTLMPAAGDLRARFDGHPVSGFNKSDQEIRMHDLVWRFLTAPRTYDWFHDTATELQRTRLTAATDDRFSEKEYYDWLHGTAYRSSATRYATLADDVAADLATLPETFDAICAVQTLDRQRATAARAIIGIGAGTKADMLARRAENEAAIGWFTRALAYRNASYSYALDHLLVETPDVAGKKADGLLADLAAWTAEARSGEFCTRGRSGRVVARPVPAIPSRFSQKPDSAIAGS